MAKGFGLLGVIVVVLSTTLPVGFNLLVGFLGLMSVTIGAFGGDKMFSIAAVGVFIINLVFMSPITLAFVFGGAIGVGWFTGISGMAFLLGVILFTLLPIIAMALFATGKLVLSSGSAKMEGDENSPELDIRPPRRVD